MPGRAYWDKGAIEALMAIPETPARRSRPKIAPAPPAPATPDSPLADMIRQIVREELQALAGRA